MDIPKGHKNRFFLPVLLDRNTLINNIKTSLQSEFLKLTDRFLIIFLERNMHQLIKLIGALFINQKLEFSLLIYSTNGIYYDIEALISRDDSLSLPVRSLKELNCKSFMS